MRIRLTFAAVLMGMLPMAGALAGEPPDAPPDAVAGEDKPVLAEFHLADGSKITGQVEIEAVTIATAYGQLKVPVSELLRLRVARGSDEATRAKVADLIAKLGAAKFEVRQKASEELLKLGPVAMEQLREATKKNSDAEIRTRAEKLLDELESSLAEAEDEDEVDTPLVGQDDEIVTRRFTARGRIEVENFSMETKYGKLNIPRGQVIAAVFGTRDDISKRVKVTGQHTTTNMVKTRIKVNAGDHISIKASGSINYQNWGQACSPEGNQNYFGNYNNHPGMALLGRIGNSGTFFLVGESLKQRATESGELYLLINYQGSAGGTDGEFKVKITVTPRG